MQIKLPGELTYDDGGNIPGYDDLAAALKGMKIKSPWGTDNGTITASGPVSHLSSDLDDSYAWQIAPNTIEVRCDAKAVDRPTAMARLSSAP